LKHARIASKSVIKTISLIFLIGINTAVAAPVVYIDETAFLSDLGTLGYTPIYESFEDDAVWGDGWKGRSADGLIYAIGGWVDTNTPYAKI
jgi:hypothetical protein